MSINTVLYSTKHTRAVTHTQTIYRLYIYIYDIYEKIYIYIYHWICINNDHITIYNIYIYMCAHVSE